MSFCLTSVSDGGFLTPPDLMGLEINYVITVASLLARKRFEP